MSWMATWVHTRSRRGASLPVSACRGQKPALCRFAAIGRCHRGALCAFAHSPEELALRRGPRQGYRGHPRGPPHGHGGPHPSGGTPSSAAPVHKTVRQASYKDELYKGADEEPRGAPRGAGHAGSGHYRSGGSLSANTSRAYQLRTDDGCLRVPLHPSAAAGIATAHLELGRSLRMRRHAEDGCFLFQGYGPPRATKEWRRRVAPEPSGAHADAPERAAASQARSAAVGAHPSADATTAGDTLGAGDEASAAGPLNAAPDTPATDAPTASSSCTEALTASDTGTEQQTMQIPGDTYIKGEPESKSLPLRAGEASQASSEHQERPRRGTNEVWSTDGPVSCSTWVLPADKLRGPSDNRFLVSSPKQQAQQQQDNSNYKHGDGDSAGFTAASGNIAASAAGATAAGSASSPGGPGGPQRKGPRRPGAWGGSQQGVSGFDQHQQQQEVSGAQLPLGVRDSEHTAYTGETAGVRGEKTAQQQQAVAAEGHMSYATVPYADEWGPYWGPLPLGVPTEYALVSEQQQQQQEMGVYGLPKLRTPLDGSTAATTPAATVTVPYPFYGAAAAASWGGPGYLDLVAHYRQQPGAAQLLQQHAPSLYRE
ncbi:uncharacterized protein LOC113147113 [Cyclospora cayetanensis]|uniref:Uncharacterized protein LOC113147113 n=1 Tax=Cyclospora cayetanensis TaxID=88456 RepID=A0A6P6RXN0_9EIME|nr:uncharacterized protein LOC113147113 [Cyclospora cayetanensis]